MRHRNGCDAVRVAFGSIMGHDIAAAGSNGQVHRFYLLHPLMLSVSAKAGVEPRGLEPLMSAAIGSGSAGWGVVQCGDALRPRVERTVWSRYPTGRQALGIVAGSMVLGAILMVLASRASAHADEVSNAPACAADQVFTSAPCRATLDAIVVTVTRDYVDLSVEGRPLSMPAFVHGSLDGIDGSPVRVTLYAGTPIRIEGPALTIDGHDSPASKAEDARVSALMFLVALPLLVGFAILIRGTGRYLTDRSQR